MRPLLQETADGLGGTATPLLEKMGRIVDGLKLSCLGQAAELDIIVIIPFQPEAEVYPTG